MHKLLGLAFALSLSLSSCSSDNAVEPVPLSSRIRSTPTLKAMPDCDAMLSAVVAHWKEEAKVALLSLDDGGGFGFEVVFDAGAPEVAVDASSDADGAQGSNAGGAAEFSGTNNQEVGVDEADLAKFDGKFLYLLNGSRLEILSMPGIGELEHGSTTSIEGSPFSILLAGDRVIALSRVSLQFLEEEHPLRDIWPGESFDSGPNFGVGEPGIEGGGEPGFGGTVDSGVDAALGLSVTAERYYPQVLKVTVLDVEDRNAPLVERELYIEGDMRAARAIGTTVRLVTLSRQSLELISYPALPESFHELQGTARESAWNRAVSEAIQANNARLDQFTLADLLPRTVERVGSAFVPTDALFGGDCGSISVPADGTGRDLTSILTFDLETPGGDIEADHVLSNNAVVYSSLDTLVLAEPANENWWYWGGGDFEEATNLHVFDVAESGATAYRSSTRIPGSVSDSFGVSEKEGRLRVVTTTGQLFWRPEEPESHVFVLEEVEGAFEIAGRISGIAQGERLWASRFDGDRAFLVTFRNIDPLWTIDLTDPTAPVIRGELEVPGVSTYLHPLGEDHLLAVGRGGSDFGFDGTNEVSLFDVTDFSDPRLEDRLTLGTPSGGPGDGFGAGTSEAIHDHLAFQYWAPLGVLAVPVSASTFQGGQQTYESFLELVDVDVDSGLSVRGTIDHSEFFNSPGPEFDSVFEEQPLIRRSFFIGEHVIAVSSRGVTVHHVPSLAQTASVLLL